MKILCVSDQVDPLVYSSNVKERFSDVDAVLCAGDLPMEYIDFIVSSLNKPTYFVFGNHNLTEYSHYHHIKVRGRPQAIPYTDECDMKFSHGAVYTGFKVFAVKCLPVSKNAGKVTPLLIAGASGSRRYNNGEDQYTDGEMFRKLLCMVPALLWNKFKYGRYIDIFLTHASPRHVHDQEDPCHKGFDCFNWFIKKFKPTYLVHGHIHLYDPQIPRVTDYEGTTIINAYCRYLLDFQQK